MSMTIEISGDLEPILKAEAGRAGIDPIAYTNQLLRKSLHTDKRSAPVVSADETRLLMEINQGLSAEALERYRQLIHRRQDEAIGNEELAELTELTHQFEALQVRRLESLSKLAELRKLPLTDLMAQLEIQPPDAL